VVYGEFKVNKPIRINLITEEYIKLLHRHAHLSEVISAWPDSSEYNRAISNLLKQDAVDLHVVIDQLTRNKEDGEYNLQMAKNIVSTFGDDVLVDILGPENILDMVGKTKVSAWLMGNDMPTDKDDDIPF